MAGPQCKLAMDRLHQYVDRELSDAEMTQVKRHLDDCPPCAGHFDFQVAMKVLVYKKACPERAPADLVSRVLENIRHGGGRRPS